MSFTVLGLWIVVVQVRGPAWADLPHRGWGAQVVAMHFALPGVMSLLAVVNPDRTSLWRAAFVVFAGLGALGMALLLHGGEEVGGALRKLAHGSAVALYAASALVAVFADAVSDRLGVTPLELEAVLLSLLFFLGLSIASSLLFGASTAGGDENP